MAKVRIEIDGFAAATKTDLRNMQRDTWAFTGKYWHRTYKAIKFTRAGARRYKYAPRKGDPGGGRPFKGSYQEAKLLRKPFFSRDAGDGFDSTAPLPIGEVKPLVWSGRSRASAKASRKVNATARSSGKGKVDIIINAPALNFKQPKSKTNPRAEVTATIPAEISQMEKISLQRFERNLNRVRRRKKVR